MREERMKPNLKGLGVCVRE